MPKDAINRESLADVDDSRSEQKPIRVSLVQPSLAKYRVPVFRELARRPGIDLTLYYGLRDNLLNVAPDGFKAIESPLWSRTIAGQKLMFQGAQWRAATREKTDVLVLSWTPRYLSLPAVLLKARLMKLPTILWGHGFSKNDKLWWKAIRKIYAKFGTVLLFYDSDTADSFVTRGTDPAKVFVAQNTIDPTEIDQARDYWNVNSDRLAKFRIENGIEGPVLLFVSRLEAGNRVDLLIQATAALSARWPSLTTVIIGNGDKQRNELIDLAKELGVADRIRFLPGIYNEKEIAPWMMSADLFCYPQNIGLSLNHAFWYGLPVLTSDNRACHNPEIAALKSGVNGLTYEHGDVNSMVASIENALNNISLRDSMSNAARETMEKSFSIDRMVSGMESAIQYAYELSRQSSRQQR